MPSTVAKAFDEFDDTLKLDPSERQKAIGTHHRIREILEELEYVVGAFLQGSFARKTMVKPLRDIDMVVLIHPNLFRYVGEEVRHGFRAGAHGGPRQVMELLIQALRPHFPTATFETGKRAVTIDFGDGGFKFDVVPAIDTRGGPTSDVLIANTEINGWERSNTRQLVADVAERNQRCKGRLVHQVRMTKHAVKHNPVGEDFFGLLSESITYHVVVESLPHADACAAAFEAGVGMLRKGEILDPTKEDNLLRKLGRAAIEAAQQQFEAWSQLAEEALRLADGGDEAAAIEVWGKIFGDEFPRADAQSEHEAAVAWAAGAPTSTGRVSRARSDRRVARSSRSWRR
jgi:hypothetical protein